MTPTKPEGQKFEHEFRLGVTESKHGVTTEYCYHCGYSRSDARHLYTEGINQMRECIFAYTPVGLEPPYLNLSVENGVFTLTIRSPKRDGEIGQDTAAIELSHYEIVKFLRALDKVA